MSAGWPNFPPAGLVAFLRSRLFQNRMGAEGRDFLKKLWYAGLGTAGAVVLSTVFSILGGRILGPVSYGESTLVQSVGMLLYLPMLFGFGTASIKYASESGDLQRQSAIVSTAFLLVFLCTAISVIIYILFARRISDVFSVSPEIFLLSVVFAGLYALNALTTSALIGIGKMRAYAILQVAMAGISLLAFIVFVGNRVFSFKAIVYPLFIGYAIATGAAFIIFLRRHFKLAFSGSWASLLTRYAAYAALGGLSFALYTNIDKLLINRYMGVADVGIYRAYYAVSVGIASPVITAINTALFPVVSGYKDKKAAFDSINRLIPYAVGIGGIAIFFLQLALLKLYGSQYPVSLVWVTLFIVASLLVSAFSLYSWFFAAVGAVGMKLGSISAMALAAVSIVANTFLVPRMGVTGAVLSMIVSFAIGTAILLCLGPRYFRGGARDRVTATKSLG